MRLYSVPGNTQRLDGGAMFGNAPRAVWSKWAKPDEQGRIPLACRCLLVDEGDRRVLFETGIGAFFEPKLRERYGVVEAEHILLRSLEQRGFAANSIDVVVLSHLHFDHAGGLLSAWRAGTPSELLFPNAKYVVGAAAWQRAQQPHPRDRASFIPHLNDLLAASGRLEVVSGATSSTLGQRYQLRVSDGHTPGMLVTTVTGAAASVTFCADLIPGVPWVHLPITMGYDRFPERLIDEKRDLFQSLNFDRDWLFFTHDPMTAFARVELNDRGRYTTVDERPDGAPPLIEPD